VGKPEDGFVGGTAGKGFTQERDLVVEFLKQVTQVVGHVVVE
jgi:tRNA-dihydrouridine synthase